MRTLVMVAAALVYLVGRMPRTAHASNIAFDTAGDSAYNNGWTQGSNGGYGWGAGWNFLDSSFGPFAGTAATAADGSQNGIINSPASTLGRAWELENGVAARFLSPAPLPSQPPQSLLLTGETLSFDLDAPSDVFNVGLGARDLSNSVELISNGKGDYLFEVVPSDGRFPTTDDTGIPTINGPIHASISNNGPSYPFTLSISSLSPGAGVATYSFYPFTALEEFYAYSSGATDPLYLNNMAITPEPSAICLLGAAAIGLVVRRRRWPLVSV